MFLDDFHLLPSFAFFFGHVMLFLVSLFLIYVYFALTFANISQLYIPRMDVSHVEVILIQHVGTAATVGVAKPDDQFTCTV